MSPGPEDFREPFSGHDRATEVFVRQESAEAEQQPEVEVHDDRTRELSSTSMSRMRLEWSPEEAEAIEDLHSIVRNQMLVLFGSAHQIMNEIYWIVRRPLHQDGVVVMDPVTGYPMWEVTMAGGYEEDYSLLTNTMMKDFLFKITVRLFDWEQKAADLWGDSMFAKAMWEQSIARGFEQAHLGPGRSTVEDRTQLARRVSREERYFSIFRTLMSRKADATVRSMERLAQRLKDVVTL